MKILMINHFPLAGSGSGTYTRNLAVHLAGLGHEVTVVLPENTDEYEKIDGIKLHPVFFTPQDDAGAKARTEEAAPDASKPAPLGTSMEDALPFNFPCFTTHPRSTVAFDDLSEDELGMYIDAFSHAIEDEMETNRPDIVHGQHVWILPALATGYGVPLVLTAHGTDLMGYDKWPELRKYAEKAIKECKKVISISQDNLDLLNERFPEEKDKFIRMRNGYDPSVFYPEDLDRAEVLSGYGVKPEDLEGKDLVCFAGKLANFKGVDVLLEAVKIYENEKPETLTIIVGDGEERDALHKQAEDLGLTSVRFLGNVDQPTLRGLYNIADVDIVPSRREPFGLVAIEAMGCGIPVVASNQGGLPDFVNDEVGALAEPENASDLAEKILKVLRRGNENAGAAHTWREEIASYARENYAQDKIIKELDDLYKEVVG